MYRYLSLLTLLGLLACAGCAARSVGESNVTVRTTGDASIYGVYSRHLPGGR